MNKLFLLVANIIFFSLSNSFFAEPQEALAIKPEAPVLLAMSAANTVIPLAYKPAAKAATPSAATATTPPAANAATPSLPACPTGFTCPNGYKPGVPVLLPASQKSASTYDAGMLQVLSGLGASGDITKQTANSQFKPKGTFTVNKLYLGPTTITYTPPAFPAITSNNMRYDMIQLDTSVQNPMTLYMYTALPANTKFPFPKAQFTNNIPIAKDDNLKNEYKSPFEIPFQQLLDNDSDPDGDKLTILGIKTNAAHGNVTWDPAKEMIYYTPNDQYNGNDSFQYVVTDKNSHPNDGYYGIATATVNIKVTTDRPPVAVEDNLTPIVVGSQKWDLKALLGNDTDPDIGTKLNDHIDFVSVTDIDKQPGTVKFENGKIVYTANGKVGSYKTGKTRFNYTITDIKGKTATGVANLTIGECNSGDDCPDAKPFCNTTTKMCEACSDNSQCGQGIRAAKKACNISPSNSAATMTSRSATLNTMSSNTPSSGSLGNPATYGQCVECTGDGFCPKDEQARCDLSTNTCATCNDDKQCAAHPGKTACNSKTGGCVECTSDIQCSKHSDSKTACNTTTNQCVECVGDDGQCANHPDGKNLCKKDQFICVGCLGDNDCKDPKAARCDTGIGQCTGCTDNTQCASRFGANNICASGKCVACGSDSDCKDPNAAHCDISIGQCTGCTDNTQCANMPDKKLTCFSPASNGRCDIVTLNPGVSPNSPSDGSSLIVKLSPTDTSVNFTSIKNPQISSDPGLTGTLNGLEVTIQGSTSGYVTVTGGNINDVKIHVCYQ